MRFFFFLLYNLKLMLHLSFNKLFKNHEYDEHPLHYSFLLSACLHHHILSSHLVIGIQGIIKGKMDR